MKKTIKYILVTLTSITLAFLLFISIQEVKRRIEYIAIESLYEKCVVCADSISKNMEYFEPYLSENYSIDFNQELLTIFNGKWSNCHGVLFSDMFNDGRDLKISSRKNELTKQLINSIQKWDSTMVNEFIDKISLVYFVDGLKYDGQIEYTDDYTRIVLLRGDKPTLSYSDYMKENISYIYHDKNDSVKITISSNVLNDEISRLERTLIHELGHAKSLVNGDGPKWNQFPTDYDKFGTYRGEYVLESNRMKPKGPISLLYGKVSVHNDEKYSATEFLNVLSKLPKYTKSLYQWNNEQEYNAERHYCNMVLSMNIPETTTVLFDIGGSKFHLKKCHGLIKIN